MRIHLLLASSALLALQLFHLPLARADTYHTCAGFIDSVPTTISTQGVWCLRHDLSTAITTGNAITIATNNVTIDCNAFKLGGLAGGAGTHAIGISAANRLNATVRHCNIRGFNYGVDFYGASGGGHRVEDNRFDDNTSIGLLVGGDGSTILRNRVNDTGGSTSSLGVAYGIYAIDAVDVLDNTVNGVLPSANAGNGTAYGIFTSSNPSGSISGNRVRGLIALGSGTARGIYNNVSDRVSLVGNDLSGDGSATSIGLRCSDSSGRAKDNIINGFATGIPGCTNDGNVVAP